MTEAKREFSPKDENALSVRPMTLTVAIESKNMNRATFGIEIEVSMVFSFE
jgi:hypothetical protein